MSNMRDWIKKLIKKWKIRNCQWSTSRVTLIGNDDKWTPWCNTHQRYANKCI